MANIRKPNNVHKLQGTYREDRHGALGEALGDDKNPIPPMPGPPDTLCDEGTMEWWRVVSILQPYDVLKATDYCCLIAYCTMFGQLKRNPLLFNAALYTQLRGYMNDLGLTPVSRSKIHIGGGDGKSSTNKFNDI